MSYGSFEMNGTSVPGGPKPALDTIGGVDFQLIKIGTGGEGLFTEIGAGNPMPVTFPGGVELAAGAEVEVTACALPTGAATEATLASALAALGGITTPSDTQPISVAALPLPAGAATQSTLASILALLPAALVGGRLDVAVGAALPAGSANIGDVDVLSLPALPSGTNNIGDVDVLSLPALPTGANTIGKVDQGAAGAAAWLTTPGGNVAHDAADSGNPVKVGAKATSALPAEVANADRADLVTDLNGRLLTGQITPAMQVSKPFRYTSAQTGTNLWDPTSGKRIAITHIILGSGATTAARFILWFGANGDTTYTAGTDQLICDITFTPSASATPGAVIALPDPIFCTTADHEVHVTTDAGLTIGGVVYGYEW